MNVSYASTETNSLPFEVTFITNGLTRAATFVTKMQKKSQKSHKISQLQNQAYLEHRRFVENCQRHWQCQFDSTTFSC